MRIATTLLASCALLVSVPATAQTPPAALVANCKPTSADEVRKGINNCDVTVIVPAGCGSGIQVAPDPIVVEGPATITWKIRSSGTWVFADDGIQIRSTGREFSTPTKDSRDSTVFTTRRLAKEAGIFKYDINLKRGAETCRHDPTVINQ